MATKTGIFNLARYKLKQARVVNPAGAVEMSEVYEGMRDAVLRDHPWNFAKLRTTLTNDATHSDWKYSYTYTLPTDPFCLRVLRLEDSAEKWEVGYGGKLLCDLGPPLRVEMIVRVTDEAAFDPAFTAALAARLAFEVGPSAGTTGTRLAELWDEYRAKLTAARSVDGQEGNYAEVEATDYLDARA